MACGIAESPDKTRRAPGHYIMIENINVALPPLPCLVPGPLPKGLGFLFFSSTVLNIIIR